MPLMGRADTGGRLIERASERARTLHTMRGTILAVVGLVAVGQTIFTAIWLGLLLSGNEPASRGWGVTSLVLNVLMNIIMVFLAWMILEALGRIERETDRVQQFTDNVYRKL